MQKEPAFILRQAETAAIPFGKRGSDRNGCGWIACYNVQLLLSRQGLCKAPPPPEKLAEKLGHFLLLGGRLGLSPFVVAGYLYSLGLKLAIAPGKEAVSYKGGRSAGGILYYLRGDVRRGAHFAAFAPGKKAGTLHFYNGSLSEGTLAEFYKADGRANRCKRPPLLSLAVVVKGRRRR